MTTVFTTGSWRPFQGQEQEFLARWREFAAWATGLPGAGRAILGEDVRDRGRYVSYIEWETWDMMRAWKDHSEFKPRMARVQQHVDKFSPTEIELVAACLDGSAR